MGFAHQGLWVVADLWVRVCQSPPNLVDPKRYGMDALWTRLDCSAISTWHESQHNSPLDLFKLNLIPRLFTCSAQPTSHCLKTSARGHSEHNEEAQLDAILSRNCQEIEDHSMFSTSEWLNLTLLVIKILSRHQSKPMEFIAKYMFPTQDRSVWLEIS